MDIAVTPAFERIARVLAGRRIGANGIGDAESTGTLVDNAYEDHLGDAVAVFKTPREPSGAMAHAGDPAVWARRSGPGGLETHDPGGDRGSRSRTRGAVAAQR